jgi:stage II sporulation protein AA (anti-sigma F factor antagonist)
MTASRVTTLGLENLAADGNVAGTPTFTVDVAVLPADADGRGSAVAVLTGRLDAVEAVRLRQQFAAVLEAGVRLLVVDLADVHFVDSAGLAALVRARRDIVGTGGTMVLISPALQDALRVFRLTQFDDVFRMVQVRGND